MESIPEVIRDYWYLLPTFFCVAVLYSSVGFGGGSSYLAILAICGIEFRSIRALALLCNIVVVSTGTYVFYRSGHLRLRRVWPLVLASIPLAFLGGTFQLTDQSFFVLLGIVLIGAAVLLWLQPARNPNTKTAKGDDASDQTPVATDWRTIAAGGSIGFLSGVVGIGGGVFLSPTLNLMKWDTAKAIAATASLFILVNSVSGLAGQALATEFTLDPTLAAALMVCVFLGGQVGSRLGARFLPPTMIRKLTAILVLVVGVRQFFR